MKKAFLAIAIVTVSFAACNSDDTKTNEVTTSDTTTIIKQEPVQVVTDTTVKTTITTDSNRVDTKMDSDNDTTKRK